MIDRDVETHCFSQPTGRREYGEVQEIASRWNKAFGELGELFGIISAEQMDERAWLLHCCNALRVIDEIRSIAEGQRIAILQSVRSEFPIARDSLDFISDDELMALSEDDLIEQDRMIFAQYGIDF